MRIRAPLWYLRLLRWLMAKAGMQSPPAPTPGWQPEASVVAILPRTRALVERAEVQFSGTGQGARRRAFVVQELADDYPASAERDRNLAVELAVRGQ